MTTISARRISPQLMRLYLRAAGALRSNHLLCRLLFGFQPPEAFAGQLWDWTTLLLSIVLARCATPDSTLLDMGTGPVCVLAIYAKRRLGVRRIVAVDYVPNVVESARAAASHARADFTIIEGDLFAGLAEKFSLIAFNAPYIDAATGERLALFASPSERQRWCGGADGSVTIARFLAHARDFLLPGGRILLGVNHFYVPDSMIRHIAQKSGFRVNSLSKSKLTKAAVYSLC